MAAEKENPPRIVKKVKKGHGHHGGAWKVAYADFVTAMMALFIVLWVMSQSQDVKQKVANYFKDPIGFSNKGKDILQGKSSSLFKTDFSRKFEPKQEEVAALKSMGDKILRDLDNEPKFNNLKGQIRIEIVKEGLRIELLDSTKDLFFQVGTSKLKEEAVQLLERIGDELSMLPNKIIIEGHTDSRPYSGDGSGYTNFELSADRANSARRALILGKLGDNQIDQVRGYADRRLRDKKDPFNHVNRRIDIIVEFSEYKE